MRRIRRVGAGSAALVMFAAAMATLAPSAGAARFSVRPVCARPAPNHVACFALEVRGSRHLSAAAGPSGYHPADLLAAYKLDASKGAGQTIAIVDAFDNPNAEADLGVYRSTFGLPPCSTANGCFRKVNQAGGATPPAANVSWGEEISLDLDMASAICPNCKILLVEATTNSNANLATAVNEAVTLGATVVSNSYGGKESSTESALASFYNHPGVPITVSSGDGAYKAKAQVPAAYSTVTAVGGTSLKPAANAGGWSESVWFTNKKEGAGSGCSKYVAKPAWQHDAKCKGRMVADVAAVADPATGVSVYDSYGASGWLVFGGTSAAAPIVAGVYALAGNGASISNASFAYSHTAGLFDVTVGSNGTCSSAKHYFCTAQAGYDGPTGLGTPNGTAAF